MDSILWIIFLSILFILGAGIYFLPSILARKDVQFKKIFFLNLLGAWTGILWIVALGWAVFYPTTAEDQMKRTELEILKFAKRKGGNVTPLEVATETSLSFDQAKKELDRFCEAGAAEVKLSENGDLVYSFLGFITDAEKLKTKSLI